MVSVSDLKSIANYGGGMIIDAKQISATDLKSIANYASGKQAQIIVKNAGSISASDLKSIANYSKGCVVFDFCG